MIYGTTHDAVACRSPPLLCERPITNSTPSQSRQHLTTCSCSSGGAPQADRSLAALAEELFEEPAFKAACHKGVSMRLQRTKDGATQESRIHELAGAVRRLQAQT